MSYISESENNEETVEVLSNALNEISAIINNNPANNDDWVKIKRIIDQANFEIDF